MKLSLVTDSLAALPFEAMKIDMGFNL